MTMELAMLETTESEPRAADHTAAAAPRRPAHVPLPWLLPGLVSAGLLWMAFFPLSWGPAAWFALVPLLSLMRLQVSPARVFCGAYLSGVLFFLTALQWMRVADDRMWITWAMLSLYCAAYFPVGIFLMRLLDRRTSVPPVLSVPMVWTALEFVRSFLLTGFAWYFLGYSQHANLPMIQIADLAGVYGVSFVLAAANGFLFECLWQSLSLRRFLGVKELRPRRAVLTLACHGVGVALLLGGTFAYGCWQLARGECKTGPRLAMLQGNIDQRIRNEATRTANGDNWKDMLDSYKELTYCAAWRQTPELIVWPESGFPYLWVKLPFDRNQVTDEVRQWADGERQLMRALVPTYQLLGTECDVFDEQGQRRRYNSAVLLHPADGPEERYDKIHRVPFGEYVPLRDWLPFMKHLSPYGFEWEGIGVGTAMTRFTLDRYRFGVLICNEDSDPVLARTYGSDGSAGPAVDFLVNISNDGWFADSCQHEEHLAICRFRAIECRRAVARAVNTGISAIIDSNGRVRKPEPLPLFRRQGIEFWEIEPTDGRFADLPEAEWPQYKNVKAVLRGTVPIDDRVSLYVYWGDWLPWACCGVIALGFGWSRRRPVGQDSDPGPPKTPTRIA